MFEILMIISILGGGKVLSLLCIALTIYFLLETLARSLGFKVVKKI